MKMLVFLLLFALLTLGINAQEKPDTTLNRWVPGVVAGLNISQIAFSNWTQGGENSLAWTITGKFNAMYKTEKWEFKNELKAVYGQTKIASDGVKVTDNELFMETVYSYNIGWIVDPFIGNNILTQISTGYDYTDAGKIEIANFFDPGYITQSIGFTYGQSKIIQTRLGLAFKETITSRFTMYSDDPDTPDKIETFKFETGLESVTDLKIPIDENTAFVSKLGLFSAFDRLDVWDVRWDNLITAKINKWLNVNLTYLLIYDKVQSPTAQMKQGLQLGITYTIL
ncbi:MAG TPA: DUF3078 domain-containing protein [Ignavibacteria bacterium]|nr:DUF3078 domain-containing protein [Ignavibacteria bacterium]